MRLFYKGKDGGPESGVTGFWLIEIKSLFSIVFLKFEEATREAFHSHAFDAWTWWLMGEVEEHHKDGRVLRWLPSWKPKYTPRSCFHKIKPLKKAWALSFRGPWSKYWFEYNVRKNEVLTLGHGRKVLTKHSVGDS